MKVKNLIKKLLELNPEAEVKLNSSEGDTLLFVNSYENNDEIVWLDGESDFDLGTELSARYLIAMDSQTDELDFYMELLDIGITIETVRKYMGDEKADHMKKFCEEHGLI